MMSCKHGQKDVVVKVLVIRQGYHISRAHKSKTIRKLIFMDAQGTMIHGLVFANTIEQFEQLLYCNKTYLICNPLVKQINSSYPNVNSKIELTMQRETTVTELPNEPLLDKIDFRFREFAHIASSQADANDQNIIGIIKKVRPLNNFNKDDDTVVHRREVILFNTLLETMTINLWDDIALNEGQLLHQIQDQNPVIAFCNLKTNTYQGIQLKSTSKTAMLVNPPCHENENMHSWLKSNTTQKTLNELWMEKMIKESNQLSLRQLKDEKDSLQQNKYYCIEASIKEIENKSSPWYEACSNCYKAVTKTSKGFNCTNCVKHNINVVQRYRITIIIQDQNETARVTLFEEVAAAFIGWPIEKYIDMHTKQQNTFDQGSMFYHQSKGDYKFLFKLDKSVSHNNGILSIIGDGFEKPGQLNSNAIDHKKRKTRSIKEIENCDHTRQSVKKKAKPRKKNPSQSSSKKDIMEIQDDEKIADFSRRMKNLKQNKDMGQKVKIKQEKI